MSERIVVVGAGVIGLTTALVLAEAGYFVEVVARDLPGDPTSQQFASPSAGANWRSFVTAEDQRECRWETITFKKMWSLIPQGLAMRLGTHDYYSEPHPPIWFRDLAPDFRELDPSELPAEEIRSGIAYTTWSVNAPEYIKWLASRLQDLGVPIIRATLTSIDEPFFVVFSGTTPCSIVVNATGLGARTILGVEDASVLPIRGQTVTTWAPHFNKAISVVVGGPGTPPTYIIPRPGGECILGGTFDINESDLVPNPETTKEIIDRCCKLEPTLPFDRTRLESVPIIRVNIGLRPARKGGARLERETITVPLEPHKLSESNTNAELKSRQVDVVHAYGTGPAGFQTSWGMAEDVLALVGESIAQRKTRAHM